MAGMEYGRKQQGIYLEVHFTTEHGYLIGLHDYYDLSR